MGCESRVDRDLQLFLLVRVEREYLTQRLTGAGLMGGLKYGIASRCFRNRFFDFGMLRFRCCSGLTALFVLHCFGRGDDGVERSARASKLPILRASLCFGWGVVGVEGSAWASKLPILRAAPQGQSVAYQEVFVDGKRVVPKNEKFGIEKDKGKVTIEISTITDELIRSDQVVEIDLDE
jgi:hypothetical protein